MGETYDLVVIGAGPGGYEAALEAAGRGMKTALAEKHLPGGICLNAGCIPTKRLLYVSDFFRQMKFCEGLGIESEPAGLNWDRLHEGVKETVAQLREGLQGMLAEAGVRLYEGEAVLMGAGSVRIGTEILHAENILVATGAAQTALNIPGEERAGVVSGEELLGRNEFFDRLTVIGAGVIGAEFASAYSSMGREVTLLEAADRILPGMDREISGNLERILKRRGVEIYKNVSISEIAGEADEKGLTIYFESKGKPFRVSSDGILNASGREPVMVPTAPGFSLRTSGGAILTDENGETSCPGIYAAGDVTGAPMLACRAAAQGRRAVSHMLGESFAADMEIIPYCVYTNPEIASVGLNADDADKMGVDAATHRYPMSANARSWISAEERGFMKLVVCRRTHKIMGAQLMCARAADLIGEFALAIALGATVEQMAAMIRPHPTFGEAVGELCRELMKKL